MPRLQQLLAGLCESLRHSLVAPQPRQLLQPRATAAIAPEPAAGHAQTTRYSNSGRSRTRRTVVSRIFRQRAPQCPQNRTRPLGHPAPGGAIACDLLLAAIPPAPTDSPSSSPALEVPCDRTPPLPTLKAANHDKASNPPRFPTMNCLKTSSRARRTPIWGLQLYLHENPPR